MLKRMQQSYSWSWVETQVAQVIDVWNSSAAQLAQGGQRFNLKEQNRVSVREMP